MMLICSLVAPVISRSGFDVRSASVRRSHTSLTPRRLERGQVGVGEHVETVGPVEQAHLDPLAVAGAVAADVAEVRGRREVQGVVGDHERAALRRHQLEVPAWRGGEAGDRDRRRCSSPNRRGRRCRRRSGSVPAYTLTVAALDGAAHVTSYPVAVCVTVAAVNGMACCFVAETAGEAVTTPRASEHVAARRAMRRMHRSGTVARPERSAVSRRSLRSVRGLRELALPLAVAALGVLDERRLPDRA